MTPAQTPERPVTPTPATTALDEKARDEAVRIEGTRMALMSFCRAIPVLMDDDVEELVNMWAKSIERAWYRAALPVPPVARSGEDAVLASQASAWFEVVDALNDVDPEWMSRAGRGVDAAVASIRALAASPAPSGEPRREK